MVAEYALFNLLILALPLAFSWFGPTRFVHRFRPTLIAATLVAIPFLVWDVAVTGRHWWFNPDHVLSPRVFGLPLEEIAFFWTVPFACTFTWEMVWGPDPGPASPRLRAVPWALLAGIPAGAVSFGAGLEYTGLALLALGTMGTADLVLRTHLTDRSAFWRFLAVVAGFTFVFNGYLTARPVVLYGEAYQLGLRIVTIPVEDFVYGTALVGTVVAVYERLIAHAPDQVRPRAGVVEKLIERAFGGYRHQVNDVDPTRPLCPDGAPRVAVVGAGLAGMTAASTLARRGFRVVLHERNTYLGGKIGAWTVTDAQGQEHGVEHGFHAFFGHYYNLRRYLEEIGADRHMKKIDDYLILGVDGRAFGFKDIARAPLLNILSLAKHGFYRIRDVIVSGGVRPMMDLLRYDPETTYRDYDGVSYAEFAERAGLPDELRLVFNTFARAFFADKRRMSMAELIKSFHFFYLSNDAGLLYEYPDGDYRRTILAPAIADLQAHGVEIRTGAQVDSMGREGEQFFVDGEPYDQVVVASDARSSRALLESSPWVRDQDPDLWRRIGKLRSGQRYAVLRLWLDRDTHQAITPFAITERRRILDAISVYHRLETESAHWVRDQGGGIFELHCYAVPDEIATDEEIRALFLEDFFHFMPELRDAQILFEHAQVRDDFTAFHLGLGRDRPETTTSIPGLYLAGDWVKLPFPAHLMEAACSAGRWAANALLRDHGLREEPVDSVPARGLLAPRRAAGAKSPSRTGRVDPAPEPARRATAP